MKILIALLTLASISTAAATNFVSQRTFDLTNGWAQGGEPEQQTIDALLSVAGNQVVYLNWRLEFPPLEAFNCANGIVDWQSSAEDAASAKNYAEYQLPVSQYSTHFLMSVLVASPLEFPLNSVSCYSSGASGVSIAIKGYYTAVEYSVPTAAALQLRPVQMPIFTQTQ